MLNLEFTRFYKNTTTNVTTPNVNDSGEDEANMTLSTSQPFTDYVEYQVARWVLLVYRPICASIGITGNLVNIVVVMTTSLRHSPTTVYIMALAFLDWCISVLSIIIMLKDAYFGELRFFRETWHCKTFFFFALFMVHFDTLTMVFMTAQRYVAVAFPLHASRWVTKSMAIASLVVAAVISALANVIHLITLEIQPFDGTYRGRCSVGSGLGQFIQIRVYPWIDFVLYFLFPTVCISIFNVLIFRTLKKAEHFKQNAVFTNSKVPTTTVSSVQILKSGAHGLGAQRTAISAATDQVRHNNTDCSQHETTGPTAPSTPNTDHSGSRTHSAIGGKNSTMLTRMLMMVSLAYLVLTFPIGVFVVTSYIWNPSGGHDKARFSLIRDITENLMFTNHSINFLLYCLSGQKFRHKAAQVLFRWCRQ